MCFSKRKFSFLLFGVMLPMACSYQSPQNTSLFEAGKSLGSNKNKNLEETSGLEASIANPGMLWAHNDSGNPAELFLLDTEAKTRKVFRLDHIRNRDWEDITLGPGPEPGINYLYIGDIGDNYARHRFKYLYRFPEPVSTDPELITGVDTLLIKLEDGTRDSETLMVDPVSKNLYLLSKREPLVGVYEIAYPFEADTLIAHKVTNLPFTQLVAGDISADGSEVLLKNYDQIYYWKKQGNESLVELLQTPAIELYYDREPQGESIAWAADGSGFYTLGENAKGQRAKLYFYKRR